MIYTHEVVNLCTGRWWDKEVNDTENMIGVVPGETLVYYIEPTRAI